MYSKGIMNSIDISTHTLTFIKSQGTELFEDNSLTFCGQKGTHDYQIYVTDMNRDNSIIDSFIHDIPLYPKIELISTSGMNVVNMIVEIPQFTTEKMEIKTTLDKNPIMYDLEDGKIRNVFYHAKGADRPGYPFHYGALPQTWENSLKIDPRTGRLGDDDPVDCFDISPIPAHTGSVRCVKVLGAIAMIDDEKTDWKIIGINIKDPKAVLYDSIYQIPSTSLSQIIDFLTFYKFYKMSKITEFNKKMIWNVDESMEIIRSLHGEWKEHKKPCSI